MQITPNPLIKNSFASPVKENTTAAEKDGSLMIYNEAQSVRGFATLSSNKKMRGRGA